MGLNLNEKEAKQLRQARLQVVMAICAQDQTLARQVHFLTPQ